LLTLLFSLLGNVIAKQLSVCVTCHSEQGGD